jgi:hypothetical protein
LPPRYRSRHSLVNLFNGKTSFLKGREGSYPSSADYIMA